MKKVDKDSLRTIEMMKKAEAERKEKSRIIQNPMYPDEIMIVYEKGKNGREKDEKEKN